MKSILLLLVIFIVATLSRCDHLILGNVGDRVVLSEHKKLEFNAIPFIKRVKQHFYSGAKEIQGIQALDQLHSKSTINVTAGGVGHKFVNLRLKSERGQGLEYDLGIYVLPDFL